MLKKFAMRSGLELLLK